MSSNTAFLTLILAALLSLSANAAERQQEAVNSTVDSGQNETIGDDAIEPAEVPGEQTFEQSSNPIIIFKPMTIHAIALVH